MVFLSGSVVGTRHHSIDDAGGAVCMLARSAEDLPVRSRQRGDPGRTSDAGSGACR